MFFKSTFIFLEKDFIEIHNHERLKLILENSLFFNIAYMYMTVCSDTRPRKGPIKGRLSMNGDFTQSQGVEVFGRRVGLGEGGGVSDMSYNCQPAVYIYI